MDLGMGGVEVEVARLCRELELEFEREFSPLRG